jgi:hypothetical protein
MQLRNSVFIASVVCFSVSELQDQLHAVEKFCIIASDICVLQFQIRWSNFIPQNAAFLVAMCISGLAWSFSFTTVIYISINITSNVFRELLYRACP